MLDWLLSGERLGFVVLKRALKTNTALLFHPFTHSVIVVLSRTNRVGAIGKKVLCSGTFGWVVSENGFQHHDVVSMA